jgi:putative tricarboxylic transport membrane protein
VSAERRSTAARVKRRQLGEAVVVLAFLALAGLVFQQTNTSFVEQGAASGGAMFNAAMFPELMAWGLILLSAIQLVGIVRVLVTDSEVEQDDDEDAPDRQHALTIALVCAALFVLYLFLLRPLGYHLTTPLFMAAFYYVLGTRNVLVAIGLGIVTSLAMSFVFEYWMNVILPVGMFGIGF